MHCGCIKKGKFDLDLKFTDCTHISIEDKSEWMEGDAYEVPSSFEAVLSVNGEDYKLDISTLRTNSFSFSDIFGGDKDKCINDAIMCFSVDTCGVTQKIFRVYMCNIRCKIDELLYKASTADDLLRVSRLNSLATKIEVCAERRHINMARELFGLLNAELKTIECGNC